MPAKIKTPKPGETIDLEYAIKRERFRAGVSPAPAAPAEAEPHPLLATPLRVFDTFAGAMGGWSLGLESTGCFQTVALCELDDFRRDVLARTFPGVRQYVDIRDVTATRLRADGIAAIDVLAGSPPCQDASLANRKGQGTRGARTGLFADFVRLASELRPRWACAENVPGLSARGLDGILADLARAGYEARVFNIPACVAGAPIARERLWILAWDATQLRRPLLFARPSQEPARASRLAREAGGFQPRNARDIWGATWREALAGAVSFSNGIPPGDARKLAEGLGDSIVPQISRAIGFAIVAAEWVETQRSAARD